MGGYGSGRRWHYTAHDVTGDYQSIDVRKWQRKKLLVPGQSFSWQWWRNDDLHSSIRVHTATDHVILSYRRRKQEDEWIDFEYPVYLMWSACHLGGKRPWFLCPVKNCGRRVAILYSNGIFSCRHCNRLVYSSQREQLHDRAASQADKIRDKLQWDPGILNLSGIKPKGMHWSTYRRLEAQHDALVRTSLNAASLKFGLDFLNY